METEIRTKFHFSASKVMSLTDNFTLPKSSSSHQFQLFVRRFFMQLFNNGDIEIVHACQAFFDFAVV